MAGEEQPGVNAVDVSPEKVAAEWASIAADEGLTGGVDCKKSAVEDSGEPERPTISAADLVGRVTGLLSTGLFYGFKWGLPAWNVAREEAGKLAAAWSKVVVKYAPPEWLSWIPSTDGGESVCIECDAVAVTIEFAKPRIEAGLKKTAPEKSSPQQKEQPGQGGGAWG